MLGLEATETELFKVWESAEYACELRVATYGCVQGTKGDTKTSEDPCERIVVVLWGKLDAEISKSSEMCESVPEEAKEVGDDSIVGPVDAQPPNQDSVCGGKTQRLEACDATTNGEFWNSTIKNTNGDGFEESVCTENRRELVCFQFLEY